MHATEPLAAQVDHLVVVAASLAEGVEWCERELGISPGPGGEHPLMGSHNRVFMIASAGFPQAYFEIIAIHEQVPFSRPAGTRRWFDMDDPALQRQLARDGPQLVHFVAHTTQLDAGLRALTRLRLDRGHVLQASRMTAQGLLRWKITVRDDGQRLFYGALPTLIEWGEAHPTHYMAPSGVTLQSLHASHPRPDALRAAYEAIGLTGVELRQGAPNLVATLQTPRGLVALESRGI